MINNIREGYTMAAVRGELDKAEMLRKQLDEVCSRVDLLIRAKQGDDLDPEHNYTQF